ncbi:MFS transporter [Pseudofrankia inefficax]|uniref:Major facilitator superfamily MFS_1 n=1 Tax=Pseudofrankia inefficax (strain DSM 45817 / CECT 9037 / DDB 130130 / EuI1c) TaxID=298654 RepID=E3J3P5_PSEI1|nr:MFS transporter [Pseudofrankia inefficax]ADP79382.1 major facilitator superfamily MFS_1 [Pseudofrankia inefficax]
MATPIPDSRRWLMLPVIMAAFFMYGFDGNVVNVAIPSLQHELHAGQAALELIVGGYVFTYAAGLVTGGRLGDLFGHRRLFLAGMASFTVASVLCGLAQNTTELVLARLLQGLTAAVMVPQVLALVAAVFPLQERPRAMSWYGVTAGLSGICGQIFGGLLLVADVFGLGWRVIFFVNVPIGLLVLGLALRLLPRADTGRRPSLDLVGVVGISGSLAFALVPLVLGRDLGWPVWAWVLLAASVPAMALVLVWEGRLARSGGQPLLDLGLFRGRIFNAGLAINATFMLFFTSTIFVMSLLLQNGLGLSALRAGLAFGPMAVLAMVASLGGRRLVTRYGLRVLTLGCAVTGAGVLLAAVALQTLGGRITEPWLVVALGLVGLGNGLILPSLVGVPLAGVAPQQAGVAAGMLSTTQQFASVTGVALIGTLFFTSLGSRTGRADYATAAELAAWVALGAVVVMTALVQVLARAVAAQAAAPAPGRPAAGSDPKTAPAGAEA